MMIGSYPCCDGELWIPMPDRTPSYSPGVCPHCGAKVWHRFSRLDPMTYTEEDFLRRFTVDVETTQITAKEPTP